MFLSASAHLPLRSNLVRFGIVRRTIFNAVRAQIGKIVIW